MTVVSLFETEQGMPLGFEAKGHTGYAPSGEDIVCAALSFLSITCANALESIAGVQPKVSTKDGYLRAEISSIQANHDTGIILQVFRQGIYDLLQAYPEHICIKSKQIR